MEEIYYVDRPSVPATQQNVIHLDAVIERSIFIDAEDINESYVAHAVEVRNSAGEIEGTLLYFPGVSHAELTTPAYTKEVEDELPEVFDVEPAKDITADPITVDEFNAESKLIDLELELAAAQQRVQDLEDEIADEEGALD